MRQTSEDFGGQIDRRARLNPQTVKRSQIEQIPLDLSPEPQIDPAAEALAFDVALQDLGLVVAQLGA